MFRALLILGFALVRLAARDLDIVLIDVEGGKAVLLVSPSGESMLIDAGWPVWRGGPSSTAVIVEAARAAGVRRIDRLVITHYDIDHFGDIPELVSQIPVGHIYDRGDFKSTERFEAYKVLRQKIGHTVVTPGDKVPLKGVDIEVLASAGRFTSRSGTPNPLCSQYPRAAVIPSDVEDDQSVGLLIRFGKFRMLDLADLEAHYSRNLVCPDNRIGNVDVFNVNVHGQFKGIAPELVHAIHARVMIQANGGRKGADARTWPVLKSAPGLEDIWQLHFSLNARREDNPPVEFIANLEGSAGHHSLRMSVSKDGSYRIVNPRNGFTKRYQARSGS